MLYAGGRGYGPGKVMSSKAHSTVAGLILTALLFFMGVQAVMAQSRPLLDSAPVVANWRGDFDGMLQRRVFRLIVPYSRTLFFVDRGRQFGLVAEFGQELETWLNQRHGKGAIRHYVAFVPTPRDKMIAALNEGKGDAIAANLTITPERQAEVDFAAPWLTGVKEIVVTGPAAPAFAALKDLSGKQVHVRTSSSYATHLAALSQRFVAEGKAPIWLRPFDDDLEDEDLLEMVHAGLLPFAVVDQHKAQAWAQVLPKLTLRDDLVVADGGEIAWAIRKGSPLLKAEMNAFFATRREGTSFGNTVLRRYFGRSKAPRPAATEGEIDKFNGLIGSFQKHGLAQDFDFLMLAAQGYQESQLVQSRRSPRGAVGVMQLLPRTAAAPPVGIRDVASSADVNIRAGAIYMRYLMQTYVNDPALDPRNRLLMTLAAYNAGPGNLRRFRRLARQQGLDPNIWFNHVEHAAARVIGRETPQYVGNIYKYYLAYSLLLEREGEALKARNMPAR